MADRFVASSILQPAAPPIAAASGSSSSGGATVAGCQKRQRAACLYDRDGRRLKGLKGEAAKLMLNHRFFSSEEELHRLEQTLAAGQRGAAPVVTDGGRSGDAYKMPALPDMFGVVAPITTGGGAVETAAGESQNNRRAVPPLHRWSHVQRRHITVRSAPADVNAGSGANALSRQLRITLAGYRWVRADAVLVEDVLASSLSAAAAAGEGGVSEGEQNGEVTGVGNPPPVWWAQLLSVPPDAELSVLHAPLADSPIAFLTVSADEYAMLDLDNDLYQPAVLSRSSNDSGTVRWRFDYTSTCKLLMLYERFGNFVVVADRWRYADAYGVSGRKATDNNNSSDDCVTPPVEVLMERYRIVSEVVLRHRHRLLQEVLKDEGATGCVEAPAPTTNAKPKVTGDAGAVKTRLADERVIASAHPLTSLLEKHPILEAQRQRREWLTQWLKQNQQQQHGEDNAAEPVEGGEEEEAREADMLARYRADVLQRCVETGVPLSGPHGNLVERKVGAKDFASLASCSPPPAASPFWYDGLLEQARRKQLHEGLAHESKVNVPYFKALMALQRVDSQATVLFSKLRALTHGPMASGQHNEEDVGVGNGKVREGTTVEAAAGSTNDAIARKATGGRKRKQQQQQQQSADPTGEDSYQAVQEEVAYIPLQCERLKLCVQAGLFLPPPVAGVNSKPNGNGTFANRALGNTAEALLLTLPSSVPRLHLGVEHELEKHLWEDHRALCDDSAEVQQLLGEARALYTQNVILRRFAGRCGALEGALKKLASDAAAMEV
ncbi:hypothetical protein DQ04_05751010 [Trypanosoma grayi]|uniref:hypothetical protein n=1 Tax=Trypanosoma grayi TaxID=71804 RepID=UPI0004F490DF|nr:hypothetical protein DQ04_05751010 [Trypanosoma grayi]KEG09132.1 hypothetical protein DQ04_05751010 [Trypanosoma grayi]